MSLDREASGLGNAAAAAVSDAESERAAAKPLASSFAEFSAITAHRGAAPTNPRNGGAAAARPALPAALAHARSVASTAYMRTPSVPEPTAPGTVPEVGAPSSAACAAACASPLTESSTAMAPSASVPCAAVPCAAAGSSPVPAAHDALPPLPPLRYRKEPGAARLVNMADKRQLLAHLSRDDYRVYCRSSQRVEQQEFIEANQAKPNFQMFFHLKATFKDAHVCGPAAAAGQSPHGSRRASGGAVTVVRLMVLAVLCCCVMLSSGPRACV
jgi:hypothetical protein